MVKKSPPHSCLFVSIRGLKTPPKSPPLFRVFRGSKNRLTLIRIHLQQKTRPTPHIRFHSWSKKHTLRGIQRPPSRRPQQSQAEMPRKQPDIGIPGASTFPAFPVSLQVASRGNSVLKIQRISFQTKLSDLQPDWFAPCRRRQPYHVVFRQPGTLAGSRPAENRISHFSSRKRRPQPQESSRPTRSAEHQ